MMAQQKNLLMASGKTGMFKRKNGIIRLTKWAVVKKRKPGDKPKKELFPGDPMETRFSQIPESRNKMVRTEMFGQLYRIKREARATLMKDNRTKTKAGIQFEKKEPRSIDKMRRPDDTLLPPEGDEEIRREDEIDEFAAYFKNETTPKLMVTTQPDPTIKMKQFIKEMVSIIPNSHYFKRESYQLKDMTEYAVENEFTDLLVWQYNRTTQKPSGLYITHLPHGPTSYWRITRCKLGTQIKGSVKCNTGENPELILNNFDTQLGHRLARQLSSLFPQTPNFRGRRNITFHNQRDYVFFRHYRYQFKDNGSRCALAEIGPRFTMKCRYLQHGTLNAREGEYEFIWRPDLQVDRKRFFV